MKRDNKGWRAIFYTTALTHEHEGGRVGTHTVARDAPGGVGGAEEEARERVGGARVAED
jgi:hypothetical protein